MLQHHHKHTSALIKPFFPLFVRNSLISERTTKIFSSSQSRSFFLKLFESRHALLAQKISPEVLKSSTGRWQISLSLFQMSFLSSRVSLSVCFVLCLCGLCLIYTDGYSKESLGPGLFPNSVHLFQQHHHDTTYKRSKYNTFLQHLAVPALHAGAIRK